MAIFIEEEKKEKGLPPFLVIILILILIITSLFLWFAFFRPSPPSVEPIGKGREVEEVKEIDFTLLENPFLKELQPFEEIGSFQGEIGRKNPFIPF